MIGYGLFIPFLPYYATLLGANLGLQIGVMSSAFMITNAIGSTPLGRLSDKIGRSPIITLGLAIYASATLAFPFAPDWTHLVLFRAVQGIGGAMLWPAATALIADTIPPGSRGKALGFFNAWVMMGLVLGPALGGGIQFYGFEILGLNELGSYRLPFYVGGLVAIISSLLALVFVKEAPRRVISKPNYAKTDLGISKSFQRTFKSLLVVRFATGFSFSFIQPILAFYVHEAIGLERTQAVLWIAAAFFVSGLAGALVQIPAGNLADKGSRKKIILIGVLASQLITFMIPLAGFVSLIVLYMGLRSVFEAFYRPAIESFEEDIMPRHVRGNLTGLTRAFSNTGAVVGPLLGFLIYDFNKSYPFYVSALILMASVILFTIISKEPTIEESED